MKAKKDYLDIISKVMLIIVIVGMVSLALYNIFRTDNIVQPEQAYTNSFKEYNYTTDTIPFEIDSVLSMYKVDSSGMAIQYLYNDTIYELYTSIIEGKHLDIYIETLYYYMDILNVQQPDVVDKTLDEIDDLKSYISCNSHIEYIDNEYFNGFIWIYDACPIYRLNN